MRTRSLIVAAAVSGIFLFAHQGSAFTVDDKSGTNSDGSARYVDPDEQLSPFLLYGAPAQTQSDEYDRSPGRRRDLPASDGSSQWLKFPGWFFSTSPAPRR